MECDPISVGNNGYKLRKSINWKMIVRTTEDYVARKMVLQKEQKGRQNFWVLWLKRREGLISINIAIRYIS